jgi:hypothetical protein
MAMPSGAFWGMKWAPWTITDFIPPLFSGLLRTFYTIFLVWTEKGPEPLRALEVSTDNTMARAPLHAKGIGLSQHLSKFQQQLKTIVAMHFAEKSEKFVKFQDCAF